MACVTYEPYHRMNPDFLLHKVSLFHTASISLKLVISTTVNETRVFLSA